MNAILSFIIIVVLTGCACTPKIETKIVEVPVAIECVKSIPVKPEYPLQGSKPDEDVFVLTKRSLAEIELRKGYEGELEAVVSGCVSHK
jgi:hypothetical protein